MILMAQRLCSDLCKIDNILNDQRGIGCLEYDIIREFRVSVKTSVSSAKQKYAISNNVTSSTGPMEILTLNRSKAFWK